LLNDLVDRLNGCRSSGLFRRGIWARYICVHAQDYPFPAADVLGSRHGCPHPGPRSYRTHGSCPRQAIPHPHSGGRRQAAGWRRQAGGCRLEAKT
jgi:hypothetical protein